MCYWECSELAVPEQLPQSAKFIRRKSRPRVLRRLKQRQLCHRRGRRRIPDITVRGLPALVFLRCDVYYDTPVPSCSISFSASQYALLLLPYLSSPSQCVLNVPHFQLTAPLCVISSCDHCPHPSPSPSIHLPIHPPPHPNNYIPLNNQYLYYCSSTYHYYLALNSLILIIIS